MSGYPGSLNLSVTQGETFRRTFTWAVDAVAVNVTGYAATLTIRTTKSAASALRTLTVGSGLTLGGSAGTIAVLIADDVTATFPVATYVWDLFMVSGGGETTPLLEGSFSVRESVTRA